MLFPIINNETVVQKLDKTRIALDQTFSTPLDENVLSINVKPEAAESYYEIANTTTLLSVLQDKSLWVFDWVYQTDGVKVISVKFSYGDPLAPTELIKTNTISVILPQDDNLFSNDQELIQHQHDILKYVTPGRSSWNFMHRRAQTLILNEIYEKGHLAVDGTKITAKEVLDVSEVRELAIFKTLRLIFESISNSKDDYFIAKAAYWEKFEKSASIKCYSKFDLNKSGTLEETETINNNVIVCGRT